MKKIAAPLLLKILSLKKTEEVQKLVVQNKIKNVPEYIGVIIAYFDLIISYGLEQQFSSNLFQSLNSFPQLISTDHLNNYNILKKVRNSFVCALVQQFFNLYLEDKQNVQSCSSFFQIWNITFPHNQLEQRRRNHYQMENSQKKHKQQQKRMIETEYNSSENIADQKNFFKNEESLKSQDSQKHNFEQECYPFENRIFPYQQEYEMQQQTDNYNYSNQYYGINQQRTDIDSQYQHYDFYSFIENK
ncbi:hypothetical protein ABPG72_016699 [Tetrahymena utriculariae]